MLQNRMLDKDWFNCTVQELFVETCTERGDKIAIVFEDQHITFAELRDNVNKVSSTFINLGIKPGDCISILPIPNPEFVYIYFATLQIGAVANPLNLLWGITELKSILERNDPKLIVTVDEHRGNNYIDLIKEVIGGRSFSNNGFVTPESIPSLTNIITVSKKQQSYEGISDYHQSVRNTKVKINDIEERMLKQKSTDIQFICQTSGSTGLSKSAMWDHRAPLSTTNFVAKNISYTEKDTFINLAPLFHNSGILALNLSLAYAGTTIYLLEQFDPLKAVEMVDEYSITTTFGFTAHWQGMKQIPNFTDYHFSIQKAIIAGDPKTYDLVLDMCQGDETIACNLYAQTEHGPLVSFGEHDCINVNLNRNTNGRPLPGVEIVIKDIDTGERLTESVAGEICYKSPYMFRGYYKQPKNTAKAFDEDGFLRSGDMGIFKGGYLYFLGRLGGVVKSGGENVSTYRVNLLLMDLLSKEINDVQTIGIRDDYWGTKVVSWIRWKSGKAMDIEDIRKKCKGMMAAYEIPKEFLVWKTEWPTTPEGKVDFKRLISEANHQLAINTN